MVNATVASVIGRWAESTPAAAAITAPSRPALTYAGLQTQIDVLGEWLAAHGVGADDRVAIVLPQGAEAAVAFIAIASAAVAAPLNPNLREPEYDTAFAELRPRAVIVLRDLPAPSRDVARRAGIAVFEAEYMPEGSSGCFTLHGAGAGPPLPRSRRSATDVALILATSGTTSRSKLVPLTHGNVCAAAANTSTAFGLRPDDRCLNPMPLFHAHGLVAAVLSSITAGASVMCTLSFEARSFFASLADYAPTWYTAVPTIHQAILPEAKRRPDVLSRHSLRFIRSASAFLSADVRADLERTFGVLVTEGYGLSEAMQLTNTPLDVRSRKPGSLGVTGSSEVAIMSRDGALLPAGAEGEIVCRGPVVMSGYLNRDDDRESFVDGWFRTGDMGRLDADGHLYMVGRLKDQINRAGEKVSPQEVDIVLAEHAAIAQAVTFGMPDEVLGEEIGVAVVLHPGATATAQEIRRFAHARLPEFKVPRRVFMVPAIPLSAMGKPLRRDLVDFLGLRAAAQATPIEVRREINERFSALEQQLMRIWAGVLQRPSLGADEDFFEVGGDSLRAAQIMLEIERVCGRHVQPSVLFAAPTIRQLARQIEETADADPSHRPLIEVQHGAGNAAPFIFLPGDYNRMGLYCRNLARKLDTEQPFYVLMPHEIDGPGSLQSIEQMAAAFLDTVRAAHPRGPYYLGGFSHAGLIAFEMARQLEASGETVALLVVIDMPVGAPTLRFVRSAVTGAGRIAALSEARITDLFLTWRDRVERFGELKRSGLSGLIGYYGRRLLGWHPPAAAYPEVPVHLEQLAIAFNRVVRRYVPGPYGGHVTLIVSEDGPAKHHSDATMGWREVAATVTVRRVPGDHWSCITEHSETVAAHLQTALDEAHAGRASVANARDAQSSSQADTGRRAALAS